MHLAQLASSLVHSLRKQKKIKVRQPLSKVLIPILEDGERERLSQVEELIISETNVKSVEYLDDTTGLLVKKIKPNFRKLGASYGPLMKQITAAINRLGTEEIASFEKDGGYDLQLDQESIHLTLEDVEILSEDIPGWTVASEGGLTVALDVTVTEDLRKEGLARDVVNRIQNLRKDRGLDVQDKINVSYDTVDPLMKEAIEENKLYIKRETQALALEYLERISNGEKLEIDGKDISVSIEVVK